MTSRHASASRRDDAARYRGISRKTSPRGPSPPPTPSLGRSRVSACFLQAAPPRDGGPPQQHPGNNWVIGDVTIDTGAGRGDGYRGDGRFKYHARLLAREVTKTETLKADHMTGMFDKAVVSGTPALCGVSLGKKSGQSLMLENKSLFSSPITHGAFSPSPSDICVRLST